MLWIFMTNICMANMEPTQRGVRWGRGGRADPSLIPYEAVSYLSIQARLLTGCSPAGTLTSPPPPPQWGQSSDEQRWTGARRWTRFPSCAGHGCEATRSTLPPSTKGLYVKRVFSVDVADVAWYKLRFAGFWWERVIGWRLLASV